ncbi:hypothetical protein RCL1_008486 [Eukaryota sp. TZLM3-RCL]
MQACVAHSPTSLSIDTVDIPVPSSNQVLVKLAISALNPVDFKMLPNLPHPYIPGIDGSGIIASVGEEASKQWSPGQRVFFHSDLKCKNGTFAEYCIVSADALIELPDDVAFDLGSLPCVAFTAIQAVNKTVTAASTHGLPAEPWALIVGLTSVVGHYCLKLLKHKGFKVAGSCREHKMSFCLGLGADLVISSDDIESCKKSVPNGFQVIIDFVNADSATKASEFVAFGGAICPVAGINLSGVDSSKLFLSGVSLLHVALGFVAYQSPFEFHRKELQLLGKETIELFRSGVFDLNIGHVISLREVPEYLDKLKSRDGVQGKIVVKF